MLEGTLTKRASRSSDFDARFAEGRERLLRICAGLVGDLAEDVVQDTYLRGRQRFDQLRDPGLFDAWVSKIAVNLCMNAHRGRRREFRMPESDFPTKVQRDPGLRELIEQLPPRDRALVVLHYGHGYRIDEIARMVGITATSARSRLFRARARLAQQLRLAENA